MAPAPADAARARGPLPARIGALLVAPRVALGEVDRHGGGVRDAVWLAVLGVVCFRLDAIVRDLLAVSHVPLLNVIQHLLGTVAQELREAAFVAMPAAVLITLFAGRGRRDPARDLELGAACYVPFFAVRALERTLTAPILLGPLPSLVKSLFAWSALAVVLLYFVMAVRIARRRSPAAATAFDAPAVTPGTPARVAVTALAVALGFALFGNITWVARHAHSVSPIPDGDEAPAFALPRVDGQAGQVALSSLRGQVVLLDFWATWCPPCVRMIPTMHELHDKWSSRGVAFVGIHAADTPEDEIAAFLRAHPVPYPVVRDEVDDTGVAGRVASQYKVMGLPHLVLLGRDGKVVKVFWGYTTKGSLDAALASATAG